MTSLRTAIYLDFKASGQNDVKRVISGAVSETRKAAQEARKLREEERAATRAKVAAERKAAKDIAAAERASRKQAAAEKKASDKIAADSTKARLAAEKAALKSVLDATRAAERIKRDEAKRTSQEARQLAQAESRWRSQVIREQRRAIAQQQRQAVQQQRTRERELARDNRVAGDIMGGVAGASTMLVGAGLAYGQENYQRSRQWIGLEDEDAIVARYGATHLGAVTTATSGGRTVQELEALMGRAADEYGVAPDVSERLLANIQNSFTAQMGSVIEHWEVINQMSAAYGADLQGVARAGAIVQRDLGVAQSDYDDALAVMAGSTTTGSIDVGDLSTQFGTTPNLLHQAFGERVEGVQGAQTFATLAQISGMSGLEGPERATALDRFLQEINDPELWKRLRHETNGRVRITEGTGANERLMDTRSVMAALMSPEFDRAGVIGEVFQSLPARQYLAGHRTAGMGYYDQLLRESTPEAGRELMAQQMAARASDPAYLARLDAGRQAATIYRQGPALLSRARNQTGYISDWEARNVGMSGMLRSPISAAASAFESVGGMLDSVIGDGSVGSYTRVLGRGRTAEQRNGLGAQWIDSILDPRLAMRRLMGGDHLALSPSGNVSAGGAGSMVQDIINRATSLGGGGGPSNVRGEVTDPIVRATQESATRIEGAISRINIGAPSAPTGSTTNPTPTRQQ